MSTRDPDADAGLARLLDPRSIAVIGASEDLAKVGGRVVHLLTTGGYRGSVFPVNPRRDTIQGLRAHASVAAIGAPPDLCVIAVAAPDVFAEVEHCLAAGAASLVVLSSGFAEQDTQGAERQARLAELVRRAGVPMIGPNCLGVMNGNNGLVASSTFAIRDRELKGGSFSFVTQSGAIGTYWLDMVQAAGFGVASWVSTGNEAAVDTAELLDHLACDAATTSIGLYVEGLRDGAGFRRAAMRARERRKPVLVLKSGRTAVGAAAAASHTGALAGEDVLYDAFFEQCGVCRVDSLSEMVDVSRVLSMQPVRPGRRTCVLSVSGGAGVLVTDAAIACGLEVPPLSSRTAAALEALLPDFATPQNPLDITAQIATDPQLLGRVVRTVVDSGEFDRMILFCGGLSNLQLAVADGMIAGVAGWDRPCVVIWQASRPPAVERLTAAGLPVFGEIPPAVLAMARAARLAEHWQSAAPEFEALPAASSGPVVALSEAASKAWLHERVALARPHGVLLRDAGEADSRLADLAGPFAVKLQSPQMLHKSGSGGIVLNVPRAEVPARVREMLALAGQRQLPCEGVLVERMLPFAFEFIVGLRRDAVLGPFLVIGRGGLEVEVDPDVARRFLPLAPVDIERMLDGLRCRALLGGFRGRPAAPLAEIARVVHRLAELFAADPSVREIEVNPLVCDAQGRVFALDALVWRDESAASS